MDEVFIMIEPFQDLREIPILYPLSDYIYGKEEQVKQKLEDRLLKISKGKIDELNETGLIDTITIHYQAVRPKSIIIKGEPYEEGKFYSISETSEALDLMESTIYSQRKLFLENHKISGYEIIRLAKRPKFCNMKNENDLEFFLKKILSPRNDLRLIYLALRYIAPDGKFHYRRVQDFFDKIHPIKGSERYKDIDPISKNQSLTGPEELISNNSEYLINFNQTGTLPKFKRYFYDEYVSTSLNPFIIALG